jgi:2,4-dienoyl-CoA reductase (NADPH2)
VKKHLNQLGITCLTETKVVAVSDQGVHVETAGGEKDVLEVDTVVLAIGSRPNSFLVQEVGDRIKEVYSIGDSVAPGKISRCISDAVELGLKI